MVGRFSKGGEITSISDTSSGIMYSLNVNCTLFPSKFSALYSGEVSIKIGGIESFGPPVGIPWLAHDEIITIHASATTINNGIFPLICIHLKWFTNIQIPANIECYVLLI
jgi:hypothetical protein